MSDVGTWSATIPEGPWGLYDTAENCWIGNDVGPTVYAADDPLNYGIARIAAQMVDVMLNQSPGRTRAVTYHAGSLRLRETVEPVMGAEAALKGIEEGRFI